MVSSSVSSLLHSGTPGLFVWVKVLRQSLALHLAMDCRIFKGGEGDVRGLVPLYELLFSEGIGL